MRKTITFDAVRRLLTELGCTERLVRDSFLVFEHESGARFGFRLYQPSEPVSGADLISLRYHLDMWGFLEQDAFEEWRQGVAV